MQAPQKQAMHSSRSLLKIAALLLAIVLALVAIAGSLTTYVPRALLDARINNVILNGTGVLVALLAAFLPPRRRIFTLACAALVFLHAWLIAGWLFPRV